MYGDEDFIVFCVIFGGGYGGVLWVLKCGMGYERVFCYDVE